jgi:predicted HAD superfamily hydrolase
MSLINSLISGNPNVHAAVQREKVGAKRIASFDVFDTLLTRTVGRPESLFLWLGNRLAAAGSISCSAEAFASAREEAERRARRNIQGGEVTLHEIYAELVWSLNIEAEDRDEIMAAEILLEDECIRIVPGAAARIAEARGGDRTIAFLSDMYLPRDFLIEQLEKHGLWSEGDQCLVSGECRHSKRSGQLFNDLLLRENISASAVSHCGNDFHADLAVPRSKGIRTIPFIAANLNRYEELLESHSRQTQGLSSAFAGASRLARLRTNAQGDHLSTIRDVSASVAAPVLTAYVLWLLNQAQQRGITRLYFVSRDGQILLQIAERLARKIGFRGECRYLYGGRQAWLLPCAASDVNQLQAFRLDDTDFLSLESQFSRMELQPGLFRAEIEQLGFPASTWSENLDSAQRDRLRDWFQSPSILEKITDEAQSRRSLLSKYLAQESVLASNNWAMVDVGWFGRLQYFLEKLLAEENAEPPAGFYFGLYERRSYPSKGSQHGYLFDGNDRPGYQRDLPFLYQLIEMFCTASHGVVLGYEQCAGRIQPILKEKRNSSAQSWGLEVLQDTILQFVDSLHLDRNLVATNADLRPCVSKLLQLFWKTPQRNEAQAWGRFQFETDQAGAYQSTLASSYSFKHIRRAYSHAGNLKRHSEEWQAASMTLTHPVLRPILAAAGRAGRAVVRAKRALGMVSP